MTSGDDLLRVGPTLRIPAAELTYRATRAGGPGGQHVNRSATGVEVLWDLRASKALSEAQRSRLLSRLATRLDRRGRLRLACDTRRSQRQNKADVTSRLVRLVAAALHVPKARRPTTPTAASRERRLAAKRQRGSLKRERRRPEAEDE